MEAECFEYGYLLIEVLVRFDQNEFYSKKSTKWENLFVWVYFFLPSISETRKDMTHGVISIDSILLNSMRKKYEFSWAKNRHN